MSGRRILPALVVSLLCLAFVPRRATILSFEERVEAQRAIERVYYTHQLGATLPFERAVPQSLLEKRVLTYLKQSVALRDYWKTPITAEMLRAEQSRILSDTRFPDRLKEIREALGNDPLLFQECFVRPVLADRLSRSFFASDAAIHGAARQEAEALRNLLLEGELDARQERAGRRVVDLLQAQEADSVSEEPLARDQVVSFRLEPKRFAELESRFSTPREEVGPVEDHGDRFSVTMVLEKESDRIRAAIYEVHKVTWDDWWQQVSPGLRESDVVPLELLEGALNPAPPGRPAFRPDRIEEVLASQQGNIGCLPADSWTAGMQGNLPDLRKLHTAVWTGMEMILWGGDGPAPVVRGNRYNPLTDTWKTMSTLNAPSRRMWHSATWTGSRMVIWGGSPPGISSALGDGGRYDPVSDTWSPVSMAGAPSPRRNHSAVWSGSQMLVFGGDSPSSYFAEGGRYDPATDTWTPMAPSGLAPRSSHSAVWTGNRMVIFGGETDQTSFSNGGRYDPSTDQWSPVSPVNGPGVRYRHVAVWTGSRMIVWGGFPELNSGKLYDPVGDNWSAMTAAPQGRTRATAVWAGTKMFIWGGTNNSSQTFDQGEVYDMATDSWHLTPPFPLAGSTVVWTGSLAIVAVGWEPTILMPIGGRYDPQSNSWTPVGSSLGAPTPRYDFGSVWTGNHLIVWGGHAFSTVTALLGTGGRYDPLTDVWTPTAMTGAPSARYQHSATWTGSHMVVWSGFQNGSPILTSTGARYEPISDTWSPTSTIGAPSPRPFALSVWTGSEVILWGGTKSLPTNGGGRYDPVADTWTSLATSNQPSARFSATAVWTGTRMIVWGGKAGEIDQTPIFPPDRGKLYDPSTDTWSPVSDTNAPSSRASHSALWTGSRMLIWGGGVGGGQYVEASDSWLPISSVGAPQGNFVSVWTGSEMIVWGGNVQLDKSNTGGRFNPASGLWAGVSQAGVPPAGVDETAVWTGQLMLVWGGTGTNQGGAYAPYGLNTDTDGDGFLACSGDCDDADAAVHPGAAEICNGRDDDCDGLLDEGFPNADADGFAACGGDCNDAAAAIHPGIPELCNGIDDNCNALVDEGLLDLDSDGSSGCGDDCDDTRGNVRPGYPEICADLLDNDCNGVVDHADLDVDGSDACAGDCNDLNPAIHPGAMETCNALDDDCDGLTDEVDVDGDGYPVCGGVDCNDANPAIHPNAVEVCNGVDDDCDSLTDEVDGDGDGYPGCAGVDCNDSDPLIHPGSPELCNGIDDDCDAIVDEGDGDGDGVACNADCYDADPGVWSPALEVTQLVLTGVSPTQLAWSDQAPLVGPEIYYSVASGTLASTPGIDVSVADCLQAVAPGTVYVDSRPSPGPGSGFWYLVQALNSCGWGTWGFSSAGIERTPPPCP